MRLIEYVLKTEDVNINNIRLGNILNSAVIRDGYFEDVTKLFPTMPKYSLTFITGEKYFKDLTNVSCIVTTKELQHLVPKDMGLVISDNPKLLFYAIHEVLMEEEHGNQAASVTRTVINSQHVMYSPVGVEIGEKCIFEPHIVLHDKVRIGDNTYIGAFADIGSEGFEIISTPAGNYMVMHRGNVFIGNYVNIQSHACIDKGVFPSRPTILEDYVSLDNFVHIAHGVQVGTNTKIAASTMVAGNTTIGKNVYIGPGARISNGITIGDNARISLGSVVTKDVPAGATVTGNFAIPHEKFIENLRRVR